MTSKRAASRPSTLSWTPARGVGGKAIGDMSRLEFQDQASATAMQAGIEGLFRPDAKKRIKEMARLSRVDASGERAQVFHLVEPQNVTGGAPEDFRVRDA